MSSQFRGRRGMLRIGAIVLVACSAFTIIHAQVTSPRSAPPRLPKGIQGLEAGQGTPPGVPPGVNWLLDARDDNERFRRLQIYASGTHVDMWQMGYRYQQVYQAIIDKNWELGTHHWTKLRDGFNIALMKRPFRTPNAEAMFLDTTWKQLDDALKAKDSEKARQAFQIERAACMACHTAEKMSFLNDAPIFRDTANFPAK